MTTATLERECALFPDFPTIVGMDEVGRGALAGPVSVGAVAVTAQTARIPVPEGLTDSKKLSPRRREALIPHIHQWAIGAVGDASNEEIDRWGIIGALRLAGRRALAQLVAQGIQIDLVLLDGKHDWLTIPPFDLLTPFDHPDRDTSLPRADKVRTLIHGDMLCASIAAASVLAKVTRDAYMVSLPDPGYSWAKNKGYASRDHVRALASLGASRLHRLSWNLPGVEDKENSE